MSVMVSGDSGLREIAPSSGVVSDEPSSNWVCGSPMEDVFLDGKLSPERPGSFND